MCKQIRKLAEFAVFDAPVATFKTSRNQQNMTKIFNNVLPYLAYENLPSYRFHFKFFWLIILFETWLHW